MANPLRRLWNGIKSMMGLDGPRAWPIYNRSQQRPRIAASYDVARSRDAHWVPADLLSAAQANDPHTRAELRRKSRYETANNSHCRGVTLTIANDLVGMGPQLQVTLPGVEIEVNETTVRNEEIIETYWQQWADEVGLAEKLNTMALSKGIDGESFAMFVTNKKLQSPIKLDLTLIETDRVTDMGLGSLKNQSERWADGIEFDAAGNPLWYTILRQYPGESWSSSPMQYDRVSAANVLHWFRKDRPGQVRGVPEILAALPLFGQLRRYTLAVIEAAETAADFAAILYTDVRPEEVDNADPWDSVEINKGTMTTVPAGWKMSQFEAEQPTATHDQFQQTILREIFHCLNMPYSVGSGDYSKDSYSSGRLGLQTYLRIVRQQRHHMKLSVLDRIFAAWLREFILLDIAPVAPVDLLGMTHDWYFDPFASIDPVKDATADEKDLANGVTTQMELCAERKRDWRKINRQRAREIADQKAKGIYVPPAGTAMPPDSQDGGQANAA